MSGPQGGVPGRGGSGPGGGACSRGGGGCLVETPPTATAAGGTHPTGMHSCYDYGRTSKRETGLS